MAPKPVPGSRPRCPHPSRLRGGAGWAMGIPSPSGCGLQAATPGTGVPAPHGSTGTTGAIRGPGAPHTVNREPTGRTAGLGRAGGSAGQPAPMADRLLRPSVGTASRCGRRPRTPRPKGSRSCWGWNWAPQGSLGLPRHCPDLGSAHRARAGAPPGVTQRRARPPLTCPTVVPSPPRRAQAPPGDPVTGGAPTGAGA